MLYDLFFALWEMFKWLILGTCIMCGLFVLFVVLPAMLFDSRPGRHTQKRKDKIRFNKELEAQHATFYNNDKNDFFDNKFFEKVQEHVFGEPVEEPFQDQDGQIFDTSIDAVLRDEAMRFLSGEVPGAMQWTDSLPTLFEEKVGEGIMTQQPNILRDSYTTFFKNADGNTDGFQQLS